MGKKPAAATPAIATLVARGIEHTVHPYEHDPSTDLGYGMEAAVALGVEPASVFKTLCVHADGRLLLAVVPVTARLDLKAVAAAAGAKKCVMADPHEAQRVTGYVVGGISPVGGRTALPVILDTSAHQHATVYVSGGRRGLDIGLTPADLVSVTHATVAPIARESS